MRGEAMAQGVHRHPFVQARFLDRRSASDMKGGGVDGMVRVASGKQERLRTRQPPVGSQDAEQLR